MQPITRPFAIAALLGATMLASPLVAARADSVPGATFRMAQAAPAAIQQTPAAAAATDTKIETVEQRIATLHGALKITPEQDAKWKAVAQAMRENAAAMDKLLAESRTTPAKSMTAVDDLNLYRKFAQAHVDGLKNLIDDFKTLYAAMSDSQKKAADEVFNTSGA